MTERALAKRVKYWQSILGLDNVRVDIELLDEPQSVGDGPAYATCYPHPHFEQLRVVFRKDLFDPEVSPARDADEVIVHELLHYLFRDYDEAARSVMDMLTDPAEELYHERLKHEEEGLVDKLAIRIVALVKP